MSPLEFYTSPSEGVRLYAREWQPADPVRGVIVLVHGLGEHCQRYAHVADFINKRGFSFLGFDLRGHGQSSGQRGHIQSFEQYLDDIDLMLEKARERHPSLPVFLYGHSLGGNIALIYALKRKPQVNGVIATSPVTAPDKIPAVKYILGKVFYTLWPAFSMDNGLDHSALSRDVSVVERYDSDPLVHTRISARLGLDMLNSGEWIKQHASELTVPLLIMQGSADRIVSVAGTREVARKAPTTLVEYKEWEGGYHELHNDFIKDEALNYMLSWIESHLA
jgi:alpha-beta hydrolase superfamily lysophospholipase